LGADPSRITVTGSLKFDSLDPSTAPGRGRERVLRFFRVSRSRLVLVAGSTSKGEEEAGIRAFNRVRTTTAGSALLILAARHPERFTEVEKLCQREGLSTIRRSELPIDNTPRAGGGVLIRAARPPNRFTKVEKLCQREGLSTIRRSDLPIDKEPRADAV